MHTRKKSTRYIQNFVITQWANTADATRGLTTMLYSLMQIGNSSRPAGVMGVSTLATCPRLRSDIRLNIFLNPDEFHTLKVMTESKNFRLCLRVLEQIILPSRLYIGTKVTPVSGVTPRYRTVLKYLCLVITRIGYSEKKIERIFKAWHSHECTND